MRSSMALLLQFYDGASIHIHSEEMSQHISVTKYEDSKDSSSGLLMDDVKVRQDLALYIDKILRKRYAQEVVEC